MRRETVTVGVVTGAASMLAFLVGLAYWVVAAVLILLFGVGIASVRRPSRRAPLVALAFAALSAGGVLLAAGLVSGDLRPCVRSCGEAGPKLDAGRTAARLEEGTGLRVKCVDSSRVGGWGDYTCTYYQGARALNAIGVKVDDERITERTG